MSPLKIFNDPVHGFIEIPRNILLQVVDHPYMQRLRRIRQLGLSAMVYPGAVHSRFSHALGAMYLTQEALRVLRAKGVPISDAELTGALLAILLHDVGHGPFSHALEGVLTPGVSHEKMGLALMHRLNDEFDGALDEAIRIFEGRSERAFFRQLISGQLDMDRMDYLIRDSFFTGVQEGIVGSERIIKTLNVHHDRLVVEHKGIYSVEKFIVARRLMYWQVYLHKTALSAECMLVKIVERARVLAQAGEPLWLDDTLGRFLTAEASGDLVDAFIRLDDNDLLYAIKQWQSARDPVLADLSDRLLNRRLLKLKFSEAPPEGVDDIRAACAKRLGLSPADAAYYVFTGQVSNRAYLKHSDEPIHILFKDGTIREILDVTDMENLNALTHQVVKYYVCAPG